MAGTRELADVVARVTDAGGKVVLVGDHHQLPEVAAGGAFRAALGVLGEQACELVVNRRQSAPWERDALDHLRAGDVEAAWAAYVAHGRVGLFEGTGAAHAAVVTDWEAARRAGHDVLVVAGTRAEARALNRLLRRRLREAGALGPALVVDERAFAVGDRVVLCRNDADQRDLTGARVRVDNGTLARVVGIDPGRGELTLALRSGQRVVLGAEYLAAGHLDHGYAVTVYKAQGATCDVALVVGPDGLYREAAYVALSRARHGSKLYATLAQAAELSERHGRGIPLPEEDQDPEDAMLGRLARSGAKTLASVEDPDALAVADLADRHAPAGLVARARHARAVERRAPADPGAAEEALTRARAVRERLAPGRRVRALDRDNVGEVVGLDDTAGTARVRFVSARGRVAERSLAWSELVVVEDPEPVPVGAAARATLARLEAEAADARSALTVYLDGHGLAPGDADRLARAARLALDRAGAALQANPPGWLDWWLGPRPTDQVGALGWDDAVRRVGAWRAAHGVAADVAGLGPEPAERAVAERWRAESLRLLETRAWLAHRDDGWPARPQPAPAAVLAARRAELEALVAQAPDDQGRLVAELVAGGLDPAALHDQLVAQAQRRSWILEHWPRVVELEQLNLLLGGSDALAHWPPALSPAVVEALARLAERPVPEAAEERTLAELDRAERAADPLWLLQARLGQLDELLAELRDPIGPEAPGDHRQLAAAGLAAVAAERERVADQLSEARRRRQAEALVASWGGGTGAVGAARERRMATVAYRAWVDQPAWVVRLVSELEGRSEGGRDRTEDLAEAVAAVAVYRDRWGVTGDDPLGAAAGGLDQQLAREEAARTMDANGVLRAGIDHG